MSYTLKLKEVGVFAIGGLGEIKTPTEFRISISYFHIVDAGIKFPEDIF